LFPRLLFAPGDAGGDHSRCGDGHPRTLAIEPGSPWENGYIESFDGKLRDELLNREIFETLLQARVLIECWRREYNTVRPHSSLGYRPPAPETILSRPPVTAPRRLASTSGLEFDQRLNQNVVSFRRGGQPRTTRNPALLRAFEHSDPTGLRDHGSPSAFFC